MCSHCLNSCKCFKSSVRFWDKKISLVLFAGSTEEREESISPAKSILPNFLIADRVKRNAALCYCPECNSGCSCCCAQLFEKARFLEIIQKRLFSILLLSDQCNFC